MRIAAANAHPLWGRPDAGAERVAEWIAEAGAQGVDLLAFGETHLGGYPFWISMTDGARWDAPDQKEAYAYYLDAAVELDAMIGRGWFLASPFTPQAALEAGATP